MKKKVLSLLIAMAMVMSLLPVSAMAAEPVMDGDVIKVDASNAQDVLDGKYGDITGKTIHFTENIEEVLDLARPTKYAGSGTVYVCGNGNSHSNESKTFTDATEFLEHFGENEWHTTPYYYRTLEDVTFTADKGVTVAGVTIRSGHVYGDVYDYVRDIDYDVGSAYYNPLTISNLTFKNVAFTGKINIETSQEDSVYDGITFEDCTFTTGGTASTYGAAIRYYSEANNGNVKNIVVKNCEFNNCYQGVYVHHVSGIAVTDSTFDAIGHNAIAMQSHNGNVDLKDVVIAENTFKNVTNRVIRFGAVGDNSSIAINNNIMVNCGDENGELIKPVSVTGGATIDLECNYWDDKDVSVAVSGLAAPTNTGINGGTWTMDIEDFLMDGATLVNNGDGTYGVDSAVVGLEGTGNVDTPYLISSLDELKWFRNAVNGGNNYDNKYVKLTADIDLGNEAWTPIGNSSTKFLGTFDGQDHTISNLFVDIETNNAGLFGFASVVKNVKLENAEVSGVISVGALVGELESSVGTVDNCHVTGTIKITGENSVGGLVGKGYANIKNSSVDGGSAETSFVLGAAGTTEEGDNVGGIIGHLGEGNTLGVANSTAKNITVKGTRKVGGIVGTTARANDYVGNTVENVIVECTATEDYANDNASTTTIGGIVGNYFGSATSGGILNDCTVENVTLVPGFATGAGALVGGDRVNNGGAPAGVDATGNTVADVTGETVSYLTGVASVGNTSFATIQEAIDAADGDTVTVLADVELTEGLLVSADDEVILDLNGKTVSYETTESKADDMIVNKGVLTITDSSEDEAGKLSYKYSGNADSSYGYDNATIQNEGTLTIQAGTVENTTAAMSHASYAINTNAGATLNVEGGKVLNLNGHAIRQVSFGTATNTVNISGGYIEGTRAVQFQLPGSASATTAPEMALNITGGELKSNEETYNLAVYVYSNGQSAEKASISVSGDAVLNGNIALNGAATGSMAEGAATVTGGTLNGAYGIFSYADADTNNAIVITGGTFATDYSAMYSADDGYDFKENEDGSFGLRVMPAGEGTETAPYQIGTLAELEWFRDKVNSGTSFKGQYLQLTADIDLAGEEWTPIGSTSNKFEGYFDGNNKTISNLKVSDAAADYAGLFGYIKGTSMAESATPTVKDLTLTNVSVTGDYYVGGLAGQGFTCKVSNVSVEGSISGTRYVGGLIGHVYTYFEDCTFTGSASCSFDALGGIAGAGDCRAYDCAVYADVTGSNWVGGIVGNGQEGTSAVGCYVKGKVSSDTNYYRGVGGIAGVAGHGYSSSVFQNNYFDGEVYLEGEKVDAIVMGIVNANSNEDIKGTVEGNSWNTEYYPATTPVYVVAEISSATATAEEWIAGASETLTGERNNNLIMLESDLEYIDAESAEDVTKMSFSEVTGAQIEEAVLLANAVAMVGDVYYVDLQEAIKAAAPAGTVEIIDDVTVDEWIMIAEKMTIGNGDLITLNINGLTINGNGHTLTINSIESAKNGNRLFYDAENLNINDLTIEYAEGVAGGIGLQSGELNNVTFEGGVYGVLPGTGEVTIEGCTFTTNGPAIYYEEARDNLVVTGNTFELSDNANIIIMYGAEEFTDNTVVSGRTVNIAGTSSATVTGNDFGDVRFKVYNDATATIENNIINNLVFDEPTVEIESTFTANALSEEAQAALEATGAENAYPITLIGPNETWENMPFITLAANGKVAGVQAAGAIGESFSVPENTTLRFWGYQGWTFTAAKGDETKTFGTELQLTAELAAWIEEMMAGDYIVTMDSKTPGIYDPFEGSTGGTLVTPGETKYTITVPAANNGDITLSDLFAATGDTVTVTVTPDEGYELDALTVVDQNGAEVTLTGSGNAYTFTMPKGDVTVKASFAKSEEEGKDPETTGLPFVDVPADYWAMDAITWAYNNGYMNGKTATTFEPYSNVSRQQVWMILARMAGENPADMAAAKAWAVENGVSDGTNPGSAVTRQQLVTLLWRFCKEPEGDVSKLAQYPDLGGVAEYAKEAMAWAVENGIITGTADGKLNPAGNASRTHFSVILYRYFAD